MEKSNLVYFLNKSLSEITFLLNTSKEIFDIEKVEQEIYYVLNVENGNKNVYSENGVKYPYNFYVRIKSDRFNFDYSICVYTMNFIYDINWDNVISVVENIFNIKAIEQ